MIHTAHRLACDTDRCPSIGPEATSRRGALDAGREEGWSLRPRTAEHFCPSCTAQLEAGLDPAPLVQTWQPSVAADVPAVISPEHRATAVEEFR